MLIAPALVLSARRTQFEPMTEPNDFDPNRYVRQLTSRPGVYRMYDAEGEVLSSIAHNEAEQLTKDGVISGGMIPKVQCALDAIAGGVKKAHIIDGRTRHACILELFTDSGIGTMITGS